MNRAFLVGLICSSVAGEISVLVRHTLGFTPCGIGDFILCATVLPLSLSRGTEFIVAFVVLKLLFAVILYGVIFFIFKRCEENRVLIAAISASLILVGMSFGTLWLK